MTQWPLNRGQIQSKWLFTVIRENDVLWRIEDTTGDLLVGLYVSTEHLTVGRAILLPGRHGPVEEHDGDESLYVLEGRLNIFLPNADAGESWYELGPGDGFYVPRAHRHQYHNVSPQNTSFLFGVAPSYLPVGPEEEVSHH